MGSAEENIKGVKFICIGEIFDRTNGNTSFTAKKDCFNQRINVLCSNHPHIRIWGHRRIDHSSIKADGVHLTNRGNYFLYNSIRGSIRHSLNHLASNSGCFNENDTKQLRGGKGRSKARR